MKRNFRGSNINGIQFMTFNKYGEFSFYATEEDLQDYLHQLPIRISPDCFKNSYNLEESRALFDWIKNKNKRDKDTCDYLL